MKRTDQRVPPPRPGEPGNVCNYYHDNGTSEQIHNDFICGITHKQINLMYETNTRQIGPLKAPRVCCICFMSFTQLIHWFVEHHVGGQ